MNSDAAKIILEQGIKIDQLEKRITQTNRRINDLSAMIKAPKFEHVGDIVWYTPWWKRLIKKIMPARI